MINVALCGAGVVGGGVLSIIASMPSQFNVTKVLVRSLDKERDFVLPANASYTTDWKDCVSTDIQMVIELIGGTTLAKEIVFTALKNNIHVVTANKAPGNQFVSIPFLVPTQVPTNVERSDHHHRHVENRTL